MHAVLTAGVFVALRSDRSQEEGAAERQSTSTSAHSGSNGPAAKRTKAH